MERDDLPFTRGYRVGQVLRMPIAHAEGNYIHTESALDDLEESGRVVFRYCSPNGEPAGDEWNINGSQRDIAGITNEAGNVLGLMPHPERCAEEILGNRDGLAIFATATGQALDQLEGAA